MNDNEKDIEETPRWFHLEKRALIAEMRLLVLASVALNQFLREVSLPKEVTIPAVVAAIVAPLSKSIVSLISRL